MCMVYGTAGARDAVFFWYVLTILLNPVNLGRRPRSEHGAVRLLKGEGLGFKTTWGDGHTKKT